VTINAAPDRAEPEPEGPKRPEKKWQILIGCLLGVFVLLAAYDLISLGMRSHRGASASGKTSPAATQSMVVSPSAAPDASNQDASPSPAASSPQRPLAVTAIGAFGPDGLSDGDHPDLAPRALQDGAQPWTSSWYLSPEFADLQTGTGLLLYMGKPVTVSSVRLVLGGQVGAAVQVRVGDTAALADLPVAASATDLSGTMTTEASGIYVLVWFTALPPIGQGKYQVSVYDVTVDGPAGT
jgi:hypothetical protein